MAPMARRFSTCSKSPRSSVTVQPYMGEVSSRAVETGALEDPSAIGISSPRGRPGTWPWSPTRGWRHAFLRRLLALADVLAGLLASLSLLSFGAGDAGQLVWSLVFVP